MIRTWMVTAAACGTMTLGVWADNPSDQKSEKQSSSPQPSAIESQQEQSLTSDAASSNPDRAFAAVVVSHMRLQRQINELVSQKATNTEIKKLAQEIYDDQKAFSRKVQAAAEKEGIILHQDRMLPSDQAVLNYLRELPVAALERNYVFYQSGRNQTGLLMCQWAAKNAQREDIRQAAQEMANKLQQRTQTLQQLATSEINGGGNPPTAVER